MAIEWLALAAVGVVAFVVVRRLIGGKVDAQRPRTHGWVESRVVDDGEPRQGTGERYGGWDEAYARPIDDDLRFRIEYSDIDGVVTERDITPRSIHMKAGRQDLVIKAFCHLRGEERSFRSDRILSARNLTTGRPISDLGNYLRSRY